MERVWNKIDTQNLVYGGGWIDVKSSVRALLFGVMLGLAKDKVKSYRSDLYHDAQWINEKINGPMSFDWVVHEGGTYIGESAEYSRIDWDKSAKYRFEILIEGNSTWMLNIYEAVPIVPVILHSCEECGIATGSNYVDHMGMWLCSDFCTGLVENRQYANKSQGQIIEKFAIEDFALPNVPDSVPNWGTEEVFVGTQEMGDDDCTGFLDNGSLQHDGDTCPTHEVERFCNENPLPENVVEALVNTDVNPINWTPEKVVEIVKNFATTIHEALPLEDCDVAETAAGCIYHPAPVKMYKAEDISVLGDSETFRPFNFHSYTEEEKREIAYANFPTLRNDSTITQRKVINMESILNELREKLDEANTARDEAYDAKNELDDAISEFDNYIDEIDTLISNLDNLPSISVSLDFQVEFES